MKGKKTPIAWLLVLGLAFVLSLAWAMTPAGTAISNQASASYIDSAGQPRTTTSNLVTTIVQQVYSFTIAPNGTEANPGQTRSGLPGAQVLFNYTVTNNGNGTDTINLSTTQGTNDGFDLLNVLIYLDSNCNGNVDAGETQVTNVTLAAGTQACVIVAATIPATATNGQYGNLNLAGTSQGDTTVTDTDNWARTTATTAAALTAFKAASPSGNVAPGATITYTISGSNTGGSPAYGYSVTVDGQSKTGILVEDVIPSGLVVSQMPTGSAGAGTVRYVYYDGTAWVTLTSSMLPISGDGTKKIGMLIEGTGAFFPQGAQYTFSFQAQVPANAPSGSTYTNSATVRFDANGDGDASDPGESLATNTTSNTVGAAYNVVVGPYGYPQGGASGSYVAGGYTVNQSGDTQTISSATAGTTVLFRHTLRNTGNAQDSYTLSVSGAPSGWTCQMVADDLTTPINGPVGPVSAGGDYSFAVKCSIPANYTGGPVNLTVTATSVNDPNKSDTTQDTVQAVADGFRFDLYGGVNGYPPYTQVQTSNGTNYTSDDTTTPTRVIYQSGTTYPSANPGGSVVYRLRVKNLNPNGLADNYQLIVTPQTGNFSNVVDSVLFYADANDDGIPDGAPIANTGLVNPNQEFKFLAVVTLKGTAPPGGVGFNFEAKSTQSSAEPLDYAYTEIWVNLIAQVTLDPDRSGTVTSPGTIVYTHTLLNNSNAPAHCDIAGSGGAYGWTYQYSTDGTNWYGGLADVYVAPNGGTTTIYVRVIVPAGEPVGRIDTNTLTANCDVTTGTPNNTYDATDAATETTTIVGGELRLTKAVDKASATPGENLTYTIVAENIGTGNLSKVIVSDPIPSYTTFQSVSATASGFPAGAQVLYSTDGTTWSTSAPPSVSTGGAVYVGVDTNGDGNITNADVMPPAARITITLVVQVQ
ncbi:hypothetical protein TJA_03400 [Thermus sp. LT1-2-5]|uniref:hypothetical protein n=1 Tax=Thermus sp. LT1-2-5 TaxID=3026935 RepID=UPI0030EAFD92